MEVSGEQMGNTNIQQIQRRSVRQSLQMGLQIGTVVLASLSFSNAAMAQLRTGRDSDREFYPEERTEQKVVGKSSAKRPLDPGVVTASAVEPVKIGSSQRSNTKPARITQKIAKDSAGSSSSRVVQAGCKNCQAGVPHSHSPIPSVSAAENVIEQEYVDNSGLSETIHDPTAMTLGSSCNSGCSSSGVIQTPNILGNILRRMNLRIEAATFWPEGQNLPQLVTTRRPANDPDTDGLIGRNDTDNLFGGSEVLGQSTQGIRGELGIYFDDCKSVGVLLRFFDAGSNSLTYGSTPTSEPVVVRPFFSTANNSQATIAVNYPTLGQNGGTSGGLNASISNDLYGGDLLFRKLILRDCAGRIEFLAGYQTARLADALSIDSTTTALVNGSAPEGTISQLSDRFMTTNRFNGMALGLNGILRERCWSLSGMVKLGFGNMERSVNIDGSSSIFVPGTPPSTSSSNEGLLARNTNNGNYVSNTFVVTPETNVTLGYRLNRRLEATIGYTYLGLPKVARVADQLDPRLASNLSNPPTGASTPSFNLLESNFSLHSLNYGLQWRY